MDHLRRRLREGVLYRDLLGRHHHEDVRERTSPRPDGAHHVDQEQSPAGRRKADRVPARWPKLDRRRCSCELLGWAAKVHEGAWTSPTSTMKNT